MDSRCINRKHKFSRRTSPDLTTERFSVIGRSSLHIFTRRRKLVRKRAFIVGLLQ